MSLDPIMDADAYESRRESEREKELETHCCIQCACCETPEEQGLEVLNLDDICWCMAYMNFVLADDVPASFDCGEFRLR